MSVGEKVIKPELKWFSDPDPGSWLNLSSNPLTPRLVGFFSSWRRQEIEECSSLTPLLLSHFHGVISAHLNSLSLLKFWYQMGWPEYSVWALTSYVKYLVGAPPPEPPFVITRGLAEAGCGSHSQEESHLMPKRKGNHPGCWAVHERQAGLPVDLVLRLLVGVAVAKVSSTWFGTMVRFLRNPPWPPGSTHISAWTWCSLSMHGIFEIRFMYSEMHSC